MSLNNTEKGRISSYLLNNITVEEIAQKIQKPLSDVQEFVDGLTSIMSAANTKEDEEAVELDEFVISARKNAIGRLCKDGVSSLNAASVVNRTIAKLRDKGVLHELESGEELYKLAKGQGGPLELMGRETPGGSPVTFMTGAASESADEARKKVQNAPNRNNRQPTIFTTSGKPKK